MITRKKQIQFTVEKNFTNDGYPYLQFFIDGKCTTDVTVLSKFVEDATGAVLPEREGKQFLGGFVTAISILNKKMDATFNGKLPEYTLSVDDAAKIAHVIAERLKIVRNWVKNFKHQKSSRGIIIVPIV